MPLIGLGAFALAAPAISPISALDTGFRERKAETGGIQIRTGGVAIRRALH